ncbi:MAG TPA: glycoside hydrolase family 15 protein [Bryobacteraceae bacterium]|nr:glycoside hydrolase family 15 protein [Bryobacteraceae bacterium]
MALRIEDYACIGNCETMALAGNDGSIDWLGLPNFESEACFAALLGDETNGRWLIAPKHRHPKVRRQYRDATLVLETEFTTPEGTVKVIDCMDRSGEHSDVLRLVRGIRGEVPMQMELIIRFNYGSVAPWVVRLPDNRLQAVAGPNQLVIDAEVEMRGHDKTTAAEFTVAEGQEVAFSLRWGCSFSPIPKSPDVRRKIDDVAKNWHEWADRYRKQHRYSEAVIRSLVTVKALAHHASGGIAAAGTTSLPEQIGGSRNWDYRYCWLRDATFTLYALMGSGYLEEAKAWREWLIRAIAGSPEKMQILYTLSGDRRVIEFEIPWLGGYENSKPVRAGNAASEQVQLDVYGEVLDMLYQSRATRLAHSDASWPLECQLLEHLEQIWNEPDEGIWEVRGGARQFTHSKVMAWAAFDRAVRTIEEFEFEGPLNKWRNLRDQMHTEICENAFDSKMGSFVQYYGAKTLDASLLQLPLVGFLPPTDPRIVGTVAAIEKNLLHDGFVMRYDTDSPVDGLKSAEGVFLACSFWLVDNYVLQHRDKEAVELFERLLKLRNDVGLLSEEYDPVAKRQVGNFPQAFSHVALINSAHNVENEESPAVHRSKGGGAHKHTAR